LWPNLNCLLPLEQTLQYFSYNYFFSFSAAPKGNQLEPKQPQPKFSWLSERSDSGVPLLSIEHEGEVHVAILSQYNPIPIEFDENRSEADPCIFKGYLQNEESAQVLVTGGCPGSDSFEVRIFHKRNFKFIIQAKSKKKELNFFKNKLQEN
jgi:hypothetical protein